MTLNLIELDRDFARLTNANWRIFGQPLCWWARCTTCLGTVESNTFDSLVAACDAHDQAGCSDVF